MTNYQHLQQICDRYPDIMKLDCFIVGNDIYLTINNPKDELIFSKEVTLKDYNCTPEEIEEIKNDMAFDIVCFLCLDTLKAISRAMEFKKNHDKASKLN